MTVVTSPHEPSGPVGLLNAARHVAQEATRLKADTALEDNSISPEKAGIIAILWQAGLLSAPLPPGRGGAGLGTTHDTATLLCSILRLIGSGSLRLGRSYEEHVSAVSLICRNGSPTEQERVAADVGAGHLLDATRLEHVQDSLRLTPAEREGYLLRRIWSRAAVHLGGIERLLDELRIHHRQTGLVQDPHYLAQLGEAAMAVETARLWVERAAHSAEDPSFPVQRTASCANLARQAVQKAGAQILATIRRSLDLDAPARPDHLEGLSRVLAADLIQPAHDGLPIPVAMTMTQDGRQAHNRQH
jgi:hypothetical protein